jgi:hypothetical protein
MTAAKATKMLLEEKQRLKNDDELNEEVAMLAIQSEKKVKCSHCEKTEHAVKHAEESTQSKHHECRIRRRMSTQRP